MTIRSTRVPLTPAQAIAAGRKAIEARRRAGAPAQRPKIPAPPVEKTAALCEGDAPNGPAMESPAALEQARPLKRDVDPISKIEASSAVATEAEVPPELHTEARAKPEPGARRKAAFNGGHVRPQRTVSLAVAPSLAPRVIPELVAPHSAPSDEAEKRDIPFGAYTLADLRQSQCRFACTPDHARPEDHRFCGRRTFVGRGNMHGSWCPEHLPLIWGQGSPSERRAHVVDRKALR